MQVTLPRPLTPAMATAIAERFRLLSEPTRLRLLDLLADPAEQVGPTVLRRWVRASGPSGVPIDSLLRRDFGAFEDALADLADRGFVLRGGG